MRKTLPPLLFVAVAFLGCASPRYQTVYRYERPAEPTGRTCLERCEQELKACQDRCQAAYQACLSSIEPQARVRHEDALKRYEAELAQYRRDLDRYQFSLSLGWGHGPWWYGHGWYDPWWPYGYGPRYYPPLPPVPPSYAEEFAKLRAEMCDRDCGCQPGYDACFLACGGRKVPELRCIANCPVGP